MKKDPSLETFLKEYDASKYEKPSLTTDIVIFSVNSEEMLNLRKNSKANLQILLIKRKEHPFKGCWALPGGFMNMEEGISTTAIRELKEETNVENVYVEQLYTWGDDVNRDPRTRVVSVSYMALINKEEQNVQASDDADAAKWFNISVVSSINAGRSNPNENLMCFENYYKLTSEDHEDELSFVVSTCIQRNKATQIKTVEQQLGSESSVAFDHGKIIDYALERLKNKLEYTPIAFNLAPEKFTLSYLQSIYEAILNKPLITQNFRRKVMPLIEDTGHFETGKQMRPAKLFIQKTNWDSWE